jgi:hypothetical protein
MSQSAGTGQGRGLPLVLGLLLPIACVPEVGSPPSLVRSPRVIAVQAQPADVEPGALIRLRLWVATPAGPAPAADLADTRWDFCTAPKPPTEDNFASPRCLLDPSALLPIAATGAEVAAEVPAEACALFGPQAPAGSAGEPARPRDPDATGGYYQPLRVVVPGLPQPTLSAVRIQCGLSTAPPEIAADFRRRYRANQAPPVPVLRREPDSGSSVDAGAGPVLRLSLSLSLPAEAAEDYLRFDPLTQTLTSQREALRLSWFATDGDLAESVTSLADRGPAGLATENRWQRPPSPQPAWLWAVLRDSRGGVSVLPVAVPAVVVVP